jgi:hypothetical protein
MSILAQTPPVVSPIVTPTLDGITFILAAYWFYCLAQPERVRKTSQYWLVFYVLILIVILYTLRLMLYTSAAGQVIVAIFIGLLHIAGLVLTVMYSGGLGGREIADNLSEAAHAFNTGGEPRKPKIVPITGQMPKRRDAPDEPPPRIVIDLPKTPRDDKGSLPLE